MVPNTFTVLDFCSIGWVGRLTIFGNRDMTITEQSSTIYMPHSLPCLYFASDALKEGKQKTKMRRHPAIFRLDWKMLLRSLKAILFSANRDAPLAARRNRGLEAAWRCNLVTLIIWVSHQTAKPRQRLLSKERASVLLVKSVAPIRSKALCGDNWIRTWSTSFRV